MLLTLEDAKTQNRCRICGEDIGHRNCPVDWQDSFREQLFPVPVVLNFGREFAHKACLEALPAETPNSAPA